MLQKRYNFKDNMSIVETELSIKACAIADLYANVMLNQGPMQVAVKDCFTGYLHSFHIRGILSHWQEFKHDEWLEAAKTWADWSIRMQGSYGDPAAYNMGYLFETKNGIPSNWFVADTTDQAVALLDIAYLLEPTDPLYIRILDSVLKFDNYIQQWNLGESGFALGYIDGKNLNQKSYHCAVARCISYYAAMYLVFNKEIYRQRGITLTNHLLKYDDFNSNYHGAPSTNRCYASFALADAYYVLAANNRQLQQLILDKVATEIIPWAIENQTTEGFWTHDRYEGDQPGATQTLENRKFGTYSWGVLYSLEIFSKLLPPINDLQNAIAKSYKYMIANLNPEDRDRWGHQSWATVAIAAKLYPWNLFPAGKGIMKPAVPEFPISNEWEKDSSSVKKEAV